MGIFIFYSSAYGNGLRICQKGAVPRGPLYERDTAGADLACNGFIEYLANVILGALIIKELSTILIFAHDFSRAFFSLSVRSNRKLWYIID